MSFRGFLKENLRSFFIITTCINVVYATLGVAFYPERQFGFEAFHSPLLLSFISLLPSVIRYSRKELNFGRTIFRQILHLLTVVAVLVAYGRTQGQMMEWGELLLFIFSVCLVYLGTTFFGWLLDRKDTRKINQALKMMQNRK